MNSVDGLKLRLKAENQKMADVNKRFRDLRTEKVSEDGPRYLSLVQQRSRIAAEITSLEKEILAAMQKAEAA